jgi:hypothetical protein
MYWKFLFKHGDLKNFPSKYGNFIGFFPKQTFVSIMLPCFLLLSGKSFPKKKDILPTI